MPKWRDGVTSTALPFRCADGRSVVQLAPVVQSPFSYVFEPIWVGQYEISKRRCHVDCDSPSTTGFQRFQPVSHPCPKSRRTAPGGRGKIEPRMARMARIKGKRQPAFSSLFPIRITTLFTSCFFNQHFASFPSCLCASVPWVAGAARSAISASSAVKLFGLRARPGRNNTKSPARVATFTVSWERQDRSQEPESGTEPIGRIRSERIAARPARLPDHSNHSNRSAAEVQCNGLSRRPL
jgi:hypothetical protein